MLKSHAHPPEHLVDNLLNFLTPACINKCRSVIDQHRSQAERLQANLDKEKEKLKEMCAKMKENKKNPEHVEFPQLQKAKDSKRKQGLTEKIAAIQNELKDVGKSLIVSLVKLISNKGLKKIVQTTVRSKAGGQTTRKLTVENLLQLKG